MSEFFKLINSQEQELTNLSGTWTVYCSESEQATISNSVLIQQSEFTTDEVGNVVGPIVELERGRITFTGILVDDSFKSAFILIEVEGYKRNVTEASFVLLPQFFGIESKLLLTLSKGLMVGPVPAVGPGPSIILLNESEYIQEKAQQIRQKIENRISVAVEAPVQLQ
jgi:hypothetical protein